MMKAGVYRITNTTDGKVYVGASLVVRRRIGHHRSLLRRGKHYNHHLQRAWDKHGEEAFVFEVVEYCRDEDVLTREQHHLDLLFATADRQSVYNVARVAEAPMTGLKASEETRRKMSEALRGKRRTAETRHRMHLAQAGRKVSDEGRANISKAKSGANHPRFGKRTPADVCEKISRAQKGRPRPEASVLKMREAKRRSGKLTEAIVRDMRDRFARGVASQSGLAREYGVGSGLVCRIINNKVWVL